jgi:integrase/recombinase XerD
MYIDNSDYSIQRFTSVDAAPRIWIRTKRKDEREQSLYEMLYSTGARISELCNLNIEDVNFQNMSAIIYGKGRKEREICFNAPTKYHLEKYLESRTDDNPALFISTRKPYNRMSPVSARIALKKIKQRNSDTANIKLAPHVFRRTVGTDMINKGAPLELVAEKLGHTKLDTTRQRYAIISRATVQNANNRYIG